jgi:hypothetical protein
LLYVTFSLTLLASAAAARPHHKDTPVPDPLAVPEGNKLKLSLTGNGVQRYECSPTNGTHTWKFIAPDADLLDHHDRPAGHHSAGPTWQALDGSQVTATKRAEASVSAASIPWLLLQAATHTGTGSFDDITYIQRLETEGGLAPATPCSEANSGEQTNIPYRATYRFYKATQCN